MDKKFTELLVTLPPLVACLVWDVLNNNITPHTIALADQVTEKEWEQYDIVHIFKLSF